MNDRFPDATPEELSSNDATCIICREEMTSAKKLVCGHLFHVHCLRSWLERQNTCPTCRALVVPAENATSTASGNRGPHQESLQQGTGTSSSDGQGSSVSAAASENMSRHEARFQAAASAASIYGRSIVYPSSANTLVWSQGNSLLPQTEVEAQRRFLESQIEVLTNQLRLLEKPTTVDTKGNLPLPPLSLTGSSPSGENLSQLKDILVSNFVKDEAMKSLIWLTAEEAAKNRGKVLSLYRQLLRSINSPKLQLSYASRLAKKAEVRTIFLFGSEEISKHNVADLIRTGEYALSQLKQGKIPNNSTQY
ncbi:unnamed protein product [Arabidopsis thaliana]|uniref:RING-type E3 ubiquitin transferase n=5 Tax=Arabidopsis TaxID=3701 RepID=A0A7G2E379_ARATH|nr:unnamed protein product [Arabidopsis thaliana]